MEEDFYLRQDIFYYYYYFVKASLIPVSANYCQLYQCSVFTAFILHIWENDSNSFHPNFLYFYSVNENSGSFYWRMDFPMHFKKEKGPDFHCKWPVMLLVACTGGRELLDECSSCYAWSEAPHSASHPTSQQIYSIGHPAVLCSVRHVVPEVNFYDHTEKLGAVGYESWVTPD